MTSRIEVPGAVSDRLFFAQVREDPVVELTALDPREGERVVVIGSGGCTALSLLATGPEEVHVVDVNRTQIHLIELKVAAISALTARDALRFLGGAVADPGWRVETYVQIAPRLSPKARSYWNTQSSAIKRGVLSSGVSERFIALIAWLIKNVVQSPGRVRRLLACGSVEEQRALFDSEWNNWRWRALFKVLLNRWSMSRAYDPAFFANVGRRNFSEHFQRMADHAIADLPVSTNYFLRHMLTGRFDADALPPYLTESGCRAVAQYADRLVLVDGSVLEHLRMLPAASVDCIALSNVCEWMTADDIAALFREVERVATPGARIVYRNFVGWTDRPTSCTLVEDRLLGEQLIASDRSAVQPRVVVCRAETAAHVAA